MVLDEPDVCRLRGEFAEAAGVFEGDDLVARAVHDEERGAEIRDDVVGVERVADEEARREVAVGERRHAGECGFEDQRGRLVSVGELGSGTTADGATVVVDVRGVDIGALDEPLVEVLRVVHDGALAGAAFGAAVAGVFRQ